MLLVITGTPGTGKSTLAKVLSEKLSLSILSVSQFVIERKLYTDYDELRKSYVIDEDRLVDALRDELKKGNVIVETIYPSVIENPDLVVLLRKDPRILYKELINRGWSELKSAENAMSEAIGYVASEAWDTFVNVCEIDVTKLNVEETANSVISRKCMDRVDWLSCDGMEEFLSFLDNVISRYSEH
jgi:adenylate kinase